MIRRGLIVIALILMTASLADAQTQAFRRKDSRAGRWETSLQTRYTASQNYTGAGGSTLSLEDDLGWGFGFGYNYDQRFSLGMLFSWRSVPYDATAVDSVDPQITEQYSGSLNTSTIAFGGEWNLLPGRITPYASGGIGWVIIDSNIAAGIGTGCWWDPWWGYVCDTYVRTYAVDAFTSRLGLGVRAELAESMFVRVGYEHGWMDLDTVGDTNMFRVDIGLMH